MRKSGRDKIAELLKKSTVEKELTPEITNEIKEGLGGDKIIEPSVEKEVDPFLAMVVAFEDFISNGKDVKHLKLKIFETKSNEFLIYQASLQNVWVVLRRSRCFFYRTSILRTVKSLGKKTVLGRYFEKYKLSGGIE